MTVASSDHPSARGEEGAVEFPDSGGALHLVTTMTPGGHRAQFWCRDGTNDESVVYAIVLDDEYGLRDRPLMGWAMDVGSHIGTAAIAMLLDNPELRVIAVEPVEPNQELIAANGEINGVSDRLHLSAAAAGAPDIGTARCSYGYREFDPDNPDYVRAHRFVGNQYRALADPEHDERVTAHSLSDLMAIHHVGELAFLKIDCEGCEYAFLADPAVARVQVIRGEYHTGYTEEPETYTPGAPDRIRALLEATHDVRLVKDDPIVGLFEAVRR